MIKHENKNITPSLYIFILKKFFYLKLRIHHLFLCTNNLKEIFQIIPTFIVGKV